MPRTLADMTEEERQACVGMWCDNLVSTAKTPDPVVLACVQGEHCWILHTTLHGNWSCFSLNAVAPRSDLQRAWMPDGMPVKGKWETAADYDGLGNGFYLDSEQPTHRRFISRWEAINEEN